MQQISKKADSSRRLFKLWDLDVKSINKNLSVIKLGRQIFFDEHQIDRLAVHVLYTYDLTTTVFGRYKCWFLMSVLLTVFWCG